MSYLSQNSSLTENQYEIKNKMKCNNGDELDNKGKPYLSSTTVNKTEFNSNCGQYNLTGQSYKIGAYLLDKVIGRGNFSVVKLALHIPTQMQVAVKVLNKSKMNSDILEKTYREVQIMKKLRHCNIVQLYQVIESSSYMFIIMEYVSQGELFDYLSQVGRLMENDARIKFSQILDAMEYCHKMNIVHRDLKAENLLMDRNFNIKLADFGFGSFYNDRYLLSTWCGSPPYAAPELFKGEPYIGPKADIWSLGVVLYAMVCGTLPFDEPYSIVKLREQVLSGLVRFPYFLSYECELLIRMILNRNPTKRPSIANIRSHKWMEPKSDNSSTLTDMSTSQDSNIWHTRVQRRSARRCNTMGDDSGFDEPIDLARSCSESNSLSIDNEYMDYEVNDNVMQMMERCGFSRSSVIEELNRNTFGNLTATYLLLCEKLRRQHQIYSPSLSDTVLPSDNSNIQPGFVPSTVLLNRFVGDTSVVLLAQDHITNVYARQGSQYDNLSTTVYTNQSSLCRTVNARRNVEDLKQIEIGNRKNRSHPVTAMVVDLVKQHNNSVDDNNCLHDAANSLSGKLQFGHNGSRSIDSRSIPTSLMIYPQEREMIRPNVSITAQPCIVLHPLMNGHVQACVLPNNNNNNNNNRQLDHQLPRFDDNRTYQQHTNPMCQVSSLYHAPSHPPPAHGIFVHSSPLQSLANNTQSTTMKPHLNKFFDMTIQHVVGNQVGPNRPINIAVRSDHRNRRSDPIFDKVSEESSESSYQGITHQLPSHDSKCVINNKCHLSSDYAKYYVRNNNIAMLTIADNNHVTSKPSLSLAEKPLLFGPFNKVQVSSISPVDINVTDLS